ncbi:MAG: FHA domain-containing protein, partial [Myxococcota bacterium]
MKVCPACQESNHNAAEFCLLCGAPLPITAQPLTTSTAVGADPGDLLVLPAGPPEPESGVLAVAVYHDQEPRVVRYFAIETDTILIGREDPARHVFPDIDLDSLHQEGVSADHVSRQHIRLTRRPKHLELEVLQGSTGTQVNRSLLQSGETTPVHAGDRII